MLFCSRAGAQIQLTPGITTVVGNGNAGYAGDGAAATSATASRPAGGLFDSAGNYFFADAGNHVVRKVAYPAMTISTVAGNGTAGSQGDAGQATGAELNGPAFLALDAAGNLYISDRIANNVRKVTLATGVISTIAGNGTAGYSGDGGAATSAMLNQPCGLAFDPSGNLYVADRGNSRIRQIAASGATISTVAGNGTAGYAGDNGAATSAEINNPNGIVVDAGGVNLYIADTSNNRIRKVTLASAVISTYAGTGTAGSSGDGSAATSAQLNEPTALALDSSGNLFSTTYADNRVREVNFGSGIISTVAGTGSAAYTGDNGPAINAALHAPTGIALDPLGNFFIADTANNAVRKLWMGVNFAAVPVGSSSSVQNVYLQTTAAETISSISVQASINSQAEFTLGTIVGCSVNGTSTVASGTICTVPVTFSPSYPGFRSSPLTVVTGTGNAAVALNASATGPLVSLSPAIISTVAGDATYAFSGDGGAATSASMENPNGLALDSAGNIYIADTTNARVRKVTASTGVITTIAGNGTQGYTGDGGAATSAAVYPTAVAVDGQGNVYISQRSYHRVRKLNQSTGVITTVAGTGTQSYTGDGGAATSATLSLPYGLAVDAAGNLYIADSGNSCIRKLTVSTGILTTVAGTGTAGFSGDGGQATAAKLNGTRSVNLDAAGNLYIGDYSNNRVRQVLASTGVISTIAGTGTAGFSGDNGSASAAMLKTPWGAAVDPAGNVYIVDNGNHRIRLLNTGTGIISSIAGTGTSGYSGDGGVATAANLAYPEGIVPDLMGNLYVVDEGNNRIRKITIKTSALSFPTSTPYGSADSADDPQAFVVRNIGNSALSLPPPGSGTNAAISANWAFDSSTTCPQLSSSSATQTIASGASCTYAVNFVPAAVGSISGSAILTDNSSGIAGSMQVVALTATSVQASPTISFAVPNHTASDASFTVAATSNSTGAFTYSVVSGPATVSGSTVTLTGSGTVTMQVSQAASTNYTAGTQSASFTVSAAAATITFAVPNHTFGDAAFTVSASSSSPGAFTYSVVSGPATLSGSTVTLTGAGTVTLQATQAASGNYSSGTASAAFTVAKASPSSTITWAAPQAITYGTALSATQLNASSTLAGTFSYSPASGVVLNAGTQTLAVVFTPTDSTDYTTGAASVSITVNKASQAISFSVSSPVTYGVSPISLSATGGASGNPVLFSVVSGSGSISASTLSINGAGTIVIAANQAASTNYTAAPAVQATLVVNKASVAIAPSSSRSPSLFGDNIVFSFVFSGAGVTPTGTATITDGTTNLASPSLNGGVVNFSTSALAAGTHNLTITYNGDSNYH